MRIKELGYILSVIFVLTSNYYIAQTKSTEIKTINGKKYYIHKVEKGQSLYAIAKTYSIDVNSILAENDDAIDGLKTGQELKIPFESLLTKNAATLIDTSKYVYHKIEKGQTIYSICKTYNTTEQLLSNYNPAISKGIKEGEYLIIGEKKFNKTSNNTNTYTVLKGETLYAISKKLNVSAEDIIKYNPEAKEGLKEGQVLKLNTRKIAINKDITFNEIKAVQTIESLQVKDSILNNKPKKTNYIIGLFLPFKLAESENLNIEDLLRVKAPFPNTQNLALDFYFGFKKAVDSLITKDFDISISLFDIQEKDSSKVEAVCKTAEFKKLDIIFGPIYAGAFKQVANYAKELGIPAVSPVTQQNKILFNNQLTSKVTPSLYTLIESLADFSTDSLVQNTNFIIVNSTAKDKPYIKTFKKRFNQNILALGKNIKDTIPEVKGIAGVKNVYVSGKKTVVVLLTTNQVYLQDFITQLDVFSNKKDIILMGFESITNIDNLDQGYLNDLNFHFATANHVDFTNPQTINLTKQYQQFYNTDPSEFYFEGFDIANYYLSNLKSEGPNMFLNLDKLNSYGVSCGFKFWRPDNTTGFENKAVSIYKYSDFKLQKLGWK